MREKTKIGHANHAFFSIYNFTWIALSLFYFGLHFGWWWHDDMPTRGEIIEQMLEADPPDFHFEEPIRRDV